MVFPWFSHGFMVKPWDHNTSRDGGPPHGWDSRGGEIPAAERVGSWREGILNHNGPIIWLIGSYNLGISIHNLVL